MANILSPTISFTAHFSYIKNTKIPQIHYIHVHSIEASYLDSHPLIIHETTNPPL